MTLFEIVILALIQGLTEFLPISSSAHLILPAELLGWRNQGLAFDVAVHVGSLLAVVIYFRKEVWAMSTAFIGHGWRKQQTQDSRLAWLVILGTIPAVIAGLLFKDVIATHARSAEVIAVTTIVFGLLLWFADARAKQTRKLESLTVKQAIVIGLAQMTALIPGTSRSGITMTAGLMLGLDRESCARFSFLLSIPTILGAGLFAVKDLLEEQAAVDWSALLYGVGFSFVSAYLCIFLFLSWISRIGMLPFVIYRLLLGAVLIAFIFW